MEGTLSEINNQFCRQVNKGVLGIVHQYRRDKATAAKKSTSCLVRQSCVHKIEITRDKTAWSRTLMKAVAVNGLNNIEKFQTGKGQPIWLRFSMMSAH